jgi:hypothetical protein
MAHDYIPRRDAEFLGWSGAFSEHINNSPEAVGLTPLLASQYAALHDAFAAAFAAASDRAVPAIEAKKTARKAAEKQAWLLVRIIQSHPETTNAIRATLAITVPDTEPTQVARPSIRPSVFVKLLFGSTVRITLRDPTSPRRGKPAGIAGAKLYSYVGETPPDSLAEWNDEGITGRPRTVITLRRGIVPGAKVWITACWYNPRGQCGPASQPKPLHVAYPTMALGQSELCMAA